MPLATMLINLERSLSGLRRKSLQVGDHRIVYSEGGKSDAEPVVLVHGFNASADSWNRIAAQLTKRYHVIAPDLPGWGASTRSDSASYGYPAQIERLHQFVGQLGLTRFHLAGHSMGGGISARYAAMFPSEVMTLGLIAPHGITEPEQSELFRSVTKGDNWLVASSMESFERLMKNLFVKRPFVPRPVLKYMAQQTIRGAEKTQRIFDEIQANSPPLLELLAHIKAPTFIVWGDQDKLIHVSAAESFCNNITNSELLIMKQTGHMPLLENVKQCGAAYVAFLSKCRAQKEAAA
ncbi:MAG TPA: alpha/beta fold hydrolase [Candidatus Angelobacter sp.]|nr:alpha/beta fold hydrolase [Candidatus Angelobacter sp.]